MAMPIDLQTMYSQISNISQNVSGKQSAAQMAEFSQQQLNIQKNLENSTKVQQTQTEKTNSANVNKDGRGGSGAYYSSKKNQQNNKLEEESMLDNSNTFDHVKEAHLGNIIDISR